MNSYDLDPHLYRTFYPAIKAELSRIFNKLYADFTGRQEPAMRMNEDLTHAGVNGAGTAGRVKSNYYPLTTAGHQLAPTQPRYPSPYTF